MFIAFFYYNKVYTFVVKVDMTTIIYEVFASSLLHLKQQLEDFIWILIHIVLKGTIFSGDILTFTVVMYPSRNNVTVDFK